MITEAVLTRERQAPVWYPTPVEERGANTIEVLRVLERAAADRRFIAQLTEQVSRALEGYALGLEEKAALVSGDLSWLESHLGRLSARLRTWPDCRLQQERW